MWNNSITEDELTSIEKIVELGIDNMRFNKFDRK